MIENDNFYHLNGRHRMAPAKGTGQNWNLTTKKIKEGNIIRTGSYVWISCLIATSDSRQQWWTGYKSHSSVTVSRRCGDELNEKTSLLSSCRRTVLTTISSREVFYMLISDISSMRPVLIYGRRIAHQRIWLRSILQNGHEQPGTGEASHVPRTVTCGRVPCWL